MDTNKENLYGLIIAKSEPCDFCQCDNRECVKIEVPGIGQLCLKENEWQKKAEELQEKVTEQQATISTLNASNCHMEFELKRVKGDRDELSKKCSKALADNKRLHQQSLWERIFNR